MECKYPQPPAVHLRIPLYARAPVQTIRPTSFYIEDLLSRNVTHGPVRTFRFPSASSIYEPTSIHPVLWHAAGPMPRAPVLVNAVSPLCALGDCGHSIAKHDRRGRPFSWGPVIPRPQQRKGSQVRFSSEQTLSMETKFETQKYLSCQSGKRLAKTLHISERQVKTWFQNRRAKCRRLTQETPLGRKGEVVEEATGSVDPPGPWSEVHRDTVPVDLSLTPSATQGR